MKAVLKYDLNEIDDRIEHLRCIKATDMALVLWEFSYNTRKELDFDKEADYVLDAVYKKFYELLEDHNINIDELIQ